MEIRAKGEIEAMFKTPSSFPPRIETGQFKLAVQRARLQKARNGSRTVDLGERVRDLLFRFDLEQFDDVGVQEVLHVVALEVNMLVTHGGVVALAHGNGCTAVNLDGSGLVS